MNDNDLELQRLMNAAMDGVATAAESVRLRSILESQPAARSQFERLKGVVAALGHLEMEEPPASLKQNVLRAVRANATSARSASGWLGSLGSLPMLFRPWTTLAAGAALGVLAFGILSGNLMSRAGFDSRSMTGTMLPLGRNTVYRVIQSRQFRLPQGTVDAQALSGADGFALRLTTDVPAGTEVTVSYDPGDWAASSVRQEPAGNEVMLGTGRFSVRMLRSGPGHYLLDLGPKGRTASPLQISIHSPDGVVQGELEMRGVSPRG